MNVITKYPILTSSSNAESLSEYRSTYAGFNGLEVVTKYPIVTSSSNAQTLSDYRSTYSGFFGSPSVRRAKRKSRQAKGQGFGQKLKAGAQNVLKNPFIQNVLGQKLGLNTESGGGATPEGSYTPEPTKKGLSTGVKIAIGVGVVALLGVGVYFATKKSKGK
jgi:hypothetical protein